MARMGRRGMHMGLVIQYLASIRVMELLTAQFSPTYYHFSRFRSKYSFQPPVRPLMSETKFNNHTKQRAALQFLCIMIFMFSDRPGER
jgi:hypothetical protein